MITSSSSSEQNIQDNSIAEVQKTEPKQKDGSLSGSLLDAATIPSFKTESLPEIDMQQQVEDVLLPPPPTSTSFTTDLSERPFEKLVTLYENELYYKEIIRGDHPMQEIIPADLDVVDLFHQAMNKGSYCVVPKSSTSNYKSTSTNAVYSSMKMYIDSNFPSYVVEYRSSVASSNDPIGLKLASKYPFLSVISIEYSDTLTGYEESTSTKSTTASTCGNNQQDSSLLPSNFYQVKDSMQLSPSWASTNNGDCVQMIESFAFFVDELLPFEFEQAVGNALCRCEVSFMPKYLPALPYFANWDSVSSLVDASVRD